MTRTNIRGRRALATTKSCARPNDRRERELSLGEGYDELLPHTVLLELGDLRVRVLGLEKIIETKMRAGRAKDKAVMPLLLATLDERRKLER